MYKALLAGHILCAVMWVGGGVTLHILGRRALKAGPVPRCASRRTSAGSARVCTGPWRCSCSCSGSCSWARRGYEHSQLWVSLAYLVWLISLVLGAVVYPAMVKRVQEVGPGTEEGLVRVRRMVNLNSIEIGLLLLVVIDMAVKPGV